MLKLYLTTCPDDFAGEYDDIEEMFKRGLSRLILKKRRGTADDYEHGLVPLHVMATRSESTDFDSVVKDFQFERK